MENNISLLDYNYNTALILALSLGFNDANIIGENFVFSSRNCLPTLVRDSTKIVERVNKNSMVLTGSNGNFFELPIADGYQLCEIGGSETIEYNDNKPLVPIKLKLPIPENATKTTILKGFREFFSEIVDIVNKKQIPNCNELNLNRLYHIAKCFLTSPSGYTNDNYTQLYNSFSGVKFNGKIYCGSFRSIHQLNISKNGAERNLSQLIIQAITEIYYSSQLSVLFQQELKEEIATLIKNLRKTELPAKTLELNANLPNTSSVGGRIWAGLEKLTDAIFNETPKKPNKKL